MATNATINHLAFHGTGYELVNDTLNVTVFSSQGTSESIPSYTKASTSQDGLMSKEDKVKLDDFKTADKYVTVVSGKDLSTNDFTNAYKEQLDDLASNPPTVDTSQFVTARELQTAIDDVTVDTSEFITEDQLLTSIRDNSVDTSQFVQKDGDKVLSDANYTQTEKTKLANIEANANKYVLPKATSASLGGVKIVEGNGLYMDGDTLKVNVTEAQGDFSIASTVASGLMSSSDKKALESLKAITDATTVKSGYMSTSDKIKLNGIDTLYATKSEVSSAVASVYRPKGPVNSFSDLPSNASEGDVYNIKTAGGTDVNGNSVKAGDNVVKVSNGWDVLAGTIDLSGYATTVLASTSQSGLMSKDDKIKLNGVAAGAQVNVLERVSLNGSSVTPVEKGINIPVVSTVISGLMSKEDKKSLDSLKSAINISGKYTNMFSWEMRLNGATLLGSTVGASAGSINLNGGAIYDGDVYPGGQISLCGGSVNNGTPGNGGTISATGNYGGVIDLTGSSSGGSIKGDVIFTGKPHFNQSATGISLQSGDVNIPSDTYDSIMSNFTMTGNETVFGTYSLPTASPTVKGGVKVGKALKMTAESIGVDTLEADDVYITTSDLDSIINQLTVGSAAPAGYFNNEITVTGGFNVPASVSSSFGNYDTITFGNNMFIKSGNVTVTNGTNQYVTFAKNVKFNSGIKVGDSMSVDIGTHGSLVSDYADVDLRHSYIKVGLATVSGDPVFLNKISFNAGFNTANTVSSSFGTHNTVTATNSYIDLNSSEIHVASANIFGKPTFNAGFDVADSMKTSFGKYDTIDIDNYSKLNLQNNSSLIADNSFVNLTNSELKFSSATVSGNPVFTGTPVFQGGVSGINDATTVNSGNVYISSTVFDSIMANFES